MTTPNKPDFTHAKKILTALEEGKHILVFRNDKWEDSKINGFSTSIRVDAINDPKIYTVME